jgi:3-mercaptopyruvate sulfurtransferase SseA
MSEGRKGSWVTVSLAALGLLCLAVGQGCSTPATNNPPEDQPAQYKSITATEAQALVQSHQGDPGFAIIDVRTSQEFADGHIAGAVNICVTCSSPSFTLLRKPAPQPDRHRRDAAAGLHEPL